MKVNSTSIQPNLNINTIADNLSSIFDVIINIDDKDKQKMIREEICLSYLKKAREDTLSLFHIQDDLDKITDGIDEIKTTNKSQEQELKAIKVKLGQNSKVSLYFIDGLDNSKAYIYLRLAITYNTRDVDVIMILNDAIEQSDIDAYAELGTLDIIQYVDIIFNEPALQYQVKSFLSILDAVCCENDIKIYNITTYS